MALAEVRSGTLSGQSQSMTFIYIALHGTKESGRVAHRFLNLKYVKENVGLQVSGELWHALAWSVGVNLCSDVCVSMTTRTNPSQPNQRIPDRMKQCDSV